MSKQITATLNGKPIQSVAEVKLSMITATEAPCGGRGKCGQCKVMAKGELSKPTDDELKFLTSDELADRVRLWRHCTRAYF